MIEAVEVVRDEDGGFTHPEWAELLDSLGDMEHLPLYIKSLFEKSHGCTIEVVSFEGSVDEESPACKEYVEQEGGFSLWELEPPTADAVLLSIHDTEDMPVQWWAVPSPRFAATLLKTESIYGEAAHSAVEIRPVSFPIPSSAESILNQPRLVTGHAVSDNGRGDMGQAVIAHGPYSPGNAQNHYLIGVGAECELMKGGAQVLCCVSFQDGNPQEVGPNGVTLEALLAVCADRLACFQYGPHPSLYNAEALLGIERAIEALKDRTRERDGVANGN